MKEYIIVGIKFTGKSKQYIIYNFNTRINNIIDERVLLNSCLIDKVIGGDKLDTITEKTYPTIKNGDIFNENKLTVGFKTVGNNITQYRVIAYNGFTRNVDFEILKKLNSKYGFSNINIVNDKITTFNGDELDTLEYKAPILKIRQLTQYANSLKIIVPVTADISSFRIPNIIEDINSEYTIDNKVKHIEFSPKGIEKKIEHLIISDNISSITKELMEPFKSCKIIEIECANADIKPSAFVGFDKLEKVIIRYNCIDIGGRAFSGCEELKEVQIGGICEYVENRAFSGCKIFDAAKFMNQRILRVRDKVFFKNEKTESMDISGLALSIDIGMFTGMKKLKVARVLSADTKIVDKYDHKDEAKTIGTVNMELYIPDTSVSLGEINNIINKPEVKRYADVKLKYYKTSFVNSKIVKAKLVMGLDTENNTLKNYKGLATYLKSLTDAEYNKMIVYVVKQLFKDKYMNFYDSYVDDNGIKLYISCKTNEKRVGDCSIKHRDGLIILADRHTYNRKPITSFVVIDIRKESVVKFANFVDAGVFRGTYFYSALKRFITMMIPSCKFAVDGYVDCDYVEKLEYTGDSGKVYLEDGSIFEDKVANFVKYY